MGERRRFTGIELRENRVPDESSILLFRHLLDSHDLMKSSFATTALSEQSVWTARSARGFASVLPEHGRRTHPFWSSEAGVVAFLQESAGYEGYHPARLGIEEFATEWLPRLHAARALVGTDWSGSGASGVDLEPARVHEILSAAVEERLRGLSSANRLIPASFRKLIAASEMIGGAAMMLLLLILVLQGVAVAWWYFSLVQGLGIAGLYIGRALWKDDAMGWRLSRAYQALQLVYIQTPNVVVGMLSGLFVHLTIGGTNVGLSAGFSGSVVLSVGTSMPWEVRVNLLAAAALIAITCPGLFRRLFVGYRAPAWAQSRPGLSAQSEPTA